MSEQENIKEIFGKLGVVLVQKAEKEIIEINHQMILDQSRMKKEYRKMMKENADNLKKFYIESESSLLNDYLSHIITEIYEKVARIKSNSLKRVRISLIKKIGQAIMENYSNYIKYLKTLIIKFANKRSIDESHSIVLSWRDFEKKDALKESLPQNLSNTFNFSKATENFMGGVLIKNEKDKLIYDFSLEKALEDQNLEIEKTISRLIPQEKIQSLISEIRSFINNLTRKIKDGIKEYDRV